MDRAISAATEYENVDKSVKPSIPHKPKQINAVQEKSFKEDPMAETNHLLKTLIGRMSNQPRRGVHPNIECWHCQEKGHVIMNWPKRRAGQKPLQQAHETHTNTSTNSEGEQLN